MKATGTNYCLGVEVIKKKLNIDLLICNTLDFETAYKTIDYNSKFFDFNKKIILSNRNESIEGYDIHNIGRFNSIQDYSDFMPRLIEYLDSDYLLLIQDDGHIVNPELWDERFLDFDYIGAPWPSSERWLKRFKKYEYYDIVSENFKYNRIGNGGFSLRSRKFLEYCSGFKNCDGIPEDIYFCIVNFKKAMEQNIRFAPFELAYKFSAEHSFSKFFNKHPKNNSIFKVENHFGWHGKRFNNSETLLNLKF